MLDPEQAKYEVETLALSLDSVNPSVGQFGSDLPPVLFGDGKQFAALVFVSKNVLRDSLVDGDPQNDSNSPT